MAGRFSHYRILSVSDMVESVFWENAAYFEANVGNGLPNPNGTLLEQAAGVDTILEAADEKGAEKWWELRNIKKAIHWLSYQ